MRRVPGGFPPPRVRPGTQGGKGAFLLLGSVVLLFLATCGRDGGKGLRGHVTMDGSSTVYPIAEALSEEFQLENPRVMVAVGRSGSGGGFERFCRGETDISTASRPITDPESIRCAEAGVEYLEFPIALDGISVVVNPSTTFLGCLTTRELREIWRPGSRIRTWRDLRPEFPPREISLYGPGTYSGTFDFFTEAIVGEMGASRSDYQSSEDDNVLVQGIKGDRNSLGYFGFAYLVQNRDELRVVAVDAGGGCISPTPETIRDGSYSPLGRQLYLYVKVSALQRPGAAAFLEYFMTKAVALIPPTGFLPLPERVYQENLQQILRLGTALHPPEPIEGEGDQPHG